MRKFITAWREIVHDFNWAVLALFFVYSIVAIVKATHSSNVLLFSNIIMGLIRLVGWLTIIATLVPQNSITIPARRPLPELVYLFLWVVADAVVLVYLWSLVSSNSPYLQIVHYAIVFGQIVIAILFAGIFKYSARDLGIPFKHWRIFLGLIIIAFPIGKFLQGEYFHMGIGAVSLFILFVLYLSNRKRWQGLVDDLISLRPFALPIIFCALFTFGSVWVQNSSQVPWSLPFRVFDTYTIAQGAMPEEFYYRLGLQTRLNCFMPFGWVSLLQGVIFSASHFPQALATGYLKISDLLWSFTPGIANAIAGGYFWYRSKNLPAAILFHMAVFI